MEAHEDWPEFPKWQGDQIVCSKINNEAVIQVLFDIENNICCKVTKVVDLANCNY